MKHAWGLLLVIGRGASGEPMKGDVMFTYGTDHPKMAFGAAVQNKDTPGEMLVQIGDDNVDCSTYLDAFSLGGPSGNFVYFSVDATTPGTQTGAAVSVEHSTGNNVSVNESDGIGDHRRHHAARHRQPDVHDDRHDGRRHRGLRQLRRQALLLSARLAGGRARAERRRRRARPGSRCSSAGTGRCPSA